MTQEEKKIFQKGFMVAINFLFHHHLKKDDPMQADPIAQEKFKEFLLAQSAVEDDLKATEKARNVIEEAINLRSTMDGASNCGSGFCLDSHGNCVRCKFAFAFDGTYHS